MKKSFIYILSDPREGTMKCYIGKTTNLERRFNGHLLAKDDTKKDRWIRSLISQNLKPLIDVLEEVEGTARSIWGPRERFWIADYRQAGVYEVLNHTRGGDGVCELDEEGRKKLSTSMKKHWRENREDCLAIAKDPIRCKKISESQKGKAHPWNADLPQNQPGWKQTDEAKELISQATVKTNLRRVANGGYKPHTEETKALISEKGKGRKSWNAGKTMSPEYCQKMSDATKNIPKTEEWKKKASIAATLRWQRYRQAKLTGETK